jgi:hypothetical protein
MLGIHTYRSPLDRNGIMRSDGVNRRWIELLFEWVAQERLEAI